MFASGPIRAADPKEIYYLNGKDLVEQVREWEKSNRSDPKTDVVKGSMFIGFVVGVHDASSGICLPQGVRIAQVCEIAASYVNQHPEEWERSAYSLVAKALGQAFPCGTATRTAPVPSILADPPRPYSPPRTSRRAAPSTGCESDHWIESVSDDGEIIKLEDGSIWEVVAGDSVTSSLWLPVTDVLVCEGKGKMINTDDNESVAVRRLK
jgi:hypothetical protein